jgi:nitroreductase
MVVCPEGAVRVTGRGLSPDDLLPSPDPDSKATAAQLAALMQSRRSVRRFSDREVDAAILERIVALAATAPMGIPPWDVGVVTVRGREEVQRVAREVVRGYEGFLRIFRPRLLAVMRPFVALEKYDRFASFIRPLAQEYVRG